ncbi:PIN domain-containing protein [Nocardia sp. NPDC050697]|uniref:PIN domain-containing protein n=1 Tax=Nocardia sp. NPDC050697 TaxID=3155158 RepID=UPI0033EAAFE7
MTLVSRTITGRTRPARHRRGHVGLDANPFRTLFVSAITVAELRCGLAAMPGGARRDRMRERFETRVLPLFAARVLPFDLASSRAYAELMATARADGIAIGRSDGYIAATAKAAGMSVATRDSAFRATGVPVLDPWE